MAGKSECQDATSIWRNLTTIFGGCLRGDRPPNNVAGRVVFCGFSREKVAKTSPPTLRFFVGGGWGFRGQVSHPFLLVGRIITKLPLGPGTAPSTSMR